MQRLAGLYKSLVARVKGRFRPLPANSPLSTADGPLLTTPSAPFQIPSQTECLLLRLPPELLRLCWQYTDATDPWRHRTVCRLLYDILTDLAWRDKLPWFFTMRQWAAPNRELLGQFGYLTRGFTTPRLFEQWPRPSEWPVMLPNLTSFTIDMHVSAIKTVLKEIFDDCVAKLPLLMHLELKLGAYSLNDNSNLVEGVKNLVSWINDGTLPNLKSVGMSFPAGDLQKLQLFANCVELLRPVRHRIKLRIKLKSHMLNTSGKRAVDDVAFQDFADALEALDLNSWSVRDCLSIINESIIIHPSGNAVSFPHLRELKIYVCNCTTGDYSQWQPSVFPSLQAMRVNIYTSACRDSASHQTAFSDSSSASSIFAHSWPKVRAFELDGPILLATANRVLTCFLIASIVTVKQIVPSEQPDILVYADKLASSLRYARHVHLAGFGNSGTPSAPMSVSSGFVVGTRTLPFLTNLSLERFDFLNGRALAAIMSPPTLVFLSLTRCQLAESELFVEEFNQSMSTVKPAVVDLTLTKGVGSYPPNLIIAIGKQCPRLCNFTVSYESTKDLDKIRKALPNINV